VPGNLVPSDLERLIPPGDDPFRWAEQHLLASPGIQIVTPMFRVSIPSLVPRRQENGHCHWLQDGLCTIHEDAPYGCAFLSQCSQSNALAAKITEPGRRARAEAFEQGSLYAQIWQHLWEKGLRELTTQENRRRAAVAIGGIDRAEDRKARRKAKKAERRSKKK
jgi:hypothetical protein